PCSKLPECWVFFCVCVWGGGGGGGGYGVFLASNLEWQTMDSLIYSGGKELREATLSSCVLIIISEE
ncbi:hypothetical protein ACJX0J_009602, partial [Zea mays]